MEDKILKVKEFFKKYWIYILAIAVGILLAVIIKSCSASDDGYDNFNDVTEVACDKVESEFFNDYGFELENTTATVVFHGENEYGREVFVVNVIGKISEKQNLDVFCLVGVNGYNTLIAEKIIDSISSHTGEKYTTTEIVNKWNLKQ